MAPATTGPAALGPTELQGLAAVMNLLAQVGGMDALLSNRPSERRDNRLHIGYSEAAERLNIPEKWLRERISTLPHRKFGKFVQFAEEDLRAISDMHAVNPGGTDAKESESALMSLQPSKRSRKRF
ncbi:MULTISPECIES: hypothetical protein [unclassified Streptomyces]|uniref:hypothetical protein n=1 Tax=unclassified Streptomyces TaxID=2593676 RepID=UPI0027E3FB36|nr:MULTISPECIES: hypothetical protein [unclassified Streptomyces]